MLYMASDSSKLVRLQGCFVSDRELNRLVHYWKGIRVPQDLRPEEVVQQPLWADFIAKEQEAAEADDLLDKAIEVVRKHNRASISLLQRRLRIGYSRAARLIDLLEAQGNIGPEQSGGRGREVLLTEGEE
jgi:S-DNA-T family DNA segregation ATPase FtsK/SpoIIIE